MSIGRHCGMHVTKLMGFLAMAGVWLLSPDANAQAIDPQRATNAQALFEQAVNEMEAGQLAGACKKLEEVTRLVPEGVGGKYALGVCYERMGRLASAWSQYSFAQQVAARLGQLDRAADAQGKADALKPKLATLSVTVPQTLTKVPALSVVRDGVELREALWGTAIYVDAGQHEITVSAPGYSTWKKHVEVLTDGVNVNFSIPETAIRQDPKASPTGSGLVVPVVLAPAQSDRSWQRPIGMASAGVGAVCVAAGAIFGGLALWTKNDSNETGHCNAATNECDAVGLILRERAVGLGDVSTGLLVAGAAAAVGGVVLWVTAPAQKTPGNEQRGDAAVGVELSAGWMRVRGRF